MENHLKVINLYLENFGIRTIELLTGIHNSQISWWIEDTASFTKREIKKPE
jgi:hypothetical protein